VSINASVLLVKTKGLIMVKAIEFVLTVVLVFLLIQLLKAYLDTPTVYINSQGNCVSVKLATGAGDCNKLPDTYEKVYVGKTNNVSD
jgi:hypothetical protein